MSPPDLGLAAGGVWPGPLVKAQSIAPSFPAAFKDALDSMPFSIQAAVSIAFLFAITVGILGAVRFARSKEGPRTASDMFLSAAGIMDMKPVRELANEVALLRGDVRRIADAMEGIKDLIEGREERESRHHAREEDRKDLLTTMERMLDAKLNTAGDAMKNAARHTKSLVTR